MSTCFNLPLAATRVIYVYSKQPSIQPEISVMRQLCHKRRRIPPLAAPVLSVVFWYRM